MADDASRDSARWRVRAANRARVAATVPGDAYDFRLAALLLVGITITYAAASRLSAVRGVARGQRPAWDRAVSGALLLLLVTVPLIPIQREQAAWLALFAALDLIALLGARRRLEAG
jgi:hypothetical protein